MTIYTYKYRLYLNEAKDKDGRLLFAPYSVTTAKLEHVYSGMIELEYGQQEGNGAFERRIDALDGIYERFNIDHPADYRRRSLCVGDVVETVSDDGVVAWHTVDSFGFRELAGKPYVAFPQRQMIGGGR